MMNKSTKYLKYILIIIMIYNNNIYMQNSINAKQSNKITKKQKNSINQAKALEKSNLIEEAINAYLNILDKYPNLKEAYRPLKNIYIRNKDWDNLTKITNQYLLANNNSNTSKLEAFDVYLITDNRKWEDIINDFYNKKNMNLSHMKKMLSILFANNKKDIAKDWINKIRNKTKKNNFYALEMGMYLSLNFDFKNAIDEYLLYLEYSPKSITMISQRIMLLADYEIAIDAIRDKLNKSELKESKIILSKLEFKLKKYQSSYDILNNINNIDTYKINLSNDLIKVKEFDLAETIIGELIKSSKDKKIIDKSVYQLAQIYELKVTNQIEEFPITNNIYKNTLLSSPFKSFNNDYSDLLLKAINIYDSLITYKKDFKSSFKLAEIKYKVQGDLDGAENIYQNIYNNSSSHEYKQKSLNAIINLNLSKGNIKNAINKINNNYKNNMDNESLQMLDIEKLKLYFYTLNRDSLTFYSKKILKDLPKNNESYNDILRITKLLNLYSDNDLLEYTNAKFKIIQNKRTQAIELLNTIKSDNPIYDLAQFEVVYLEIIQQNYNKAMELIKNIKTDNSYYKELKMILEGEIYDYGLDLKSEAVDIYLYFLESFPESIFYDLIRTRLRELAL